MRKGFYLSAALLLLLALAACGKPTPAPTAVPAPSTQPAATATVSPSPTATPAPPMMVLHASPNAAPEVVATAQAWLQARAAEAGAQTALLQTSTNLPPNTIAVLGVGTPPPEAPHARRLMLAATAEDIPEGVQALVLETADLAHRAFLAGYLGVLITKDWRAGLLASENESDAAQAFEDGGRYYCGLCRPLYPPFVAYPQYILLPPGSSAETWESGAQRLLRNAVKTLALSPRALQAMTTYPEGVTLIALDEPPHGQTAGFAAVLTADITSGLDALWTHPDTATLTTDIRMTILDHEAISPGRAALAEEIRQQLQKGLILP